MDCFRITRPTGNKLPILISAPHVGTLFPDGLSPDITPEFRQHPLDTDWCVDELYGFAPAMGITIIRSVYSRYVVDLNRDPSGKKLYKDSRSETGLVPEKSFAGESLYDSPLDPGEIARRVELYHRPYHAAVQEALEEFRREFGVALLYEAHSIKRSVPSIRPEPFPDLMLGTNRGQSAAPELIDLVTSRLSESEYSLQVDDPFSGGFITRTFGQPGRGIHALQLERCWDLYLDERRFELDADKSAKLSSFLEGLFEGICSWISP